MALIFTPEQILQQQKQEEASRARAMASRITAQVLAGDDVVEGQIIQREIKTTQDEQPVSASMLTMVEDILGHSGWVDVCLKNDVNDTDVWLYMVCAADS